MSQDTEREAFEHATRQEHPAFPLDCTVHADGEVIYHSAGTQHRWRGWQARASLASQQAGKGEPKDSPPVYAQLVISNCAALKTLLHNMLDPEQMERGVEAMLDQISEGVEQAMGDAYAEGRQDQLDQDREDFAASHPSREPLTAEALGIAMTNSYYDAASFIAGVRFAERHHGIHSREGGSNDRS